MIAVTGSAVLFVPVNEGMLPMPLAAIPIDASEFVQSNVVPGVVLVKTPAARFAPLQTTISAETTAIGIGLTVILYETGTPEQPFEVGVTVMSAVTGNAVLLVPVNEGEFPVPLASSPIDGSEFTQSNVVPGVVLVNTPAATFAPLQTIISEGTTTTGVGSTVIVYERGIPGQPLAVGVTVSVAITEIAVLLVAVNAGVFPVPLAARPIDASELVQSNVVPGVVLVKFEATIVAPLQTIISEGTTTTGVGLTVIVYEAGVPGQPLAVGVTVIVAITGSAVLFVPVNAGVSPMPLAARPIEASELFQSNVAPGVVLVKLEAGIAAPLQTTASAGTVTFGPGLTVMV